MKDGISNRSESLGAAPGYEPLTEVRRDYAVFEQHLLSAYNGRVRVLPNFVNDLGHRGTIPVNTEKYRRVEGVYLDESVTRSFGTQNIESIAFEPKPFRLLGRESSRREVFFGNLNIAHQGQSATMPVAVKPFTPQAFHYATHEMSMYEYMRSMDIPTLRVVGMVAVQGASKDYKEPQTYVMTSEHQGLTTLDNVEWKELSTEERWSRLRPATDTMAALHARMLFHGDMEFRNAAHGEEERTYRVVDPELMVSLRDVVTPFTTDPVEQHRVVQKMSADFGALFKSVTEIMLDEAVSEPEAYEGMKTNVYAPYSHAIERSDSIYTSVLLGAYGQVLEQKRQQAYGEWSGRSGY